jgi:hypothetical protein
MLELHSCAKLLVSTLEPSKDKVKTEIEAIKSQAFCKLSVKWMLLMMKIGNGSRITRMTLTN